jgi:tetratricopeptide (TPR) repeat protein
MSSPSIQFLSLLLSFSLLAGCAGVPKAQRLKPEPNSPQTLQVKSPKKTPPNPLAYYHFLLSQFQLKEGKLDEAIEEIKQAISYDEKDPLLRVELATLYIHKGLLNDAIEECKTALIHDPDHLAAHLLSGGIYTSLKKNLLAIESYKRAIQIDPQHRESYLFLSSLYAEEQEYDSAIQILQKFLKIEPNSVIGFYYLGRCREEIL